MPSNDASRYLDRKDTNSFKVRYGNRKKILDRSTIQPGVVIGEGSVIATNALVGKWKNIPDGEVWGGLPAKCIKKNSERPELESE